MPTPRAETSPCPCRPHEVLVAGKHGSDLRTKIVLEKQEYIRLRDAKSGNLRQVHGPATVVPSPHETVTSREPQRALKLSDLEYVIVTDTLSGAERPR